MRSSFNEALNSKHSDPMDSRTIEFDYKSVEFEPEIKTDNADELRIELEQQLAATFRRLAQYVLGKEFDVVHSGRRFIALCWVMDPSMFPETPSLRELAKRLEMDAGGLSRITAEVTRTYGLRNRAQAHGDGTRRQSKTTVGIGDS